MEYISIDVEWFCTADKGISFLRPNAPPPEKKEQQFGTVKIKIKVEK